MALGRLLMRTFMRAYEKLIFYENLLGWKMDPNENHITPRFLAKKVMAP